MFLVMCSTGEYSGRVEIPLFVTDDRELAESRVLELEELVQLLEAQPAVRNKFARDEGSDFSNWKKYTALRAQFCKDLRELEPSLSSEYFDETFRAWVAEIEER